MGGLFTSSQLFHAKILLQMLTMNHPDHLHFRSIACNSVEPYQSLLALVLMLFKELSFVVFIKLPEQSPEH